jgi:AraC family transcriptional regulator
MNEPRFEVLPEMELVGLAVSTYPMNHPKADPTLIPELWDFLFQLINATGTEVKGQMYGAQIMDGDSLSYLASFESEADLPGSERWLLPESTYAIFEHKGRVETLGNLFDDIFNTWLPTSKNQLRPSPALEIYDERFIPDSDDSIMMVAIPLED